MKKPKGKLDALLDGLGIKLVPIYRKRAAAQSHARGTMKIIRARHGGEYLTFVLRCIRETKNNRDELWSETIGAIADVFDQRPDWMNKGGDVLDAFDKISLGEIRGKATKLRPWEVRKTMRALIYIRLEELLDEPEHRLL